ncbi:MAG: cell envelope integrity protein TolA [Acidihalobacter sp.]|uniref:cell envelope integrity protein TolA n=1 Tax=Acidihalobacter sp. TaxID=1872108 RepID=UPI00307F5427
MWEELRRHPWALTAAVILNLIVLVLFGIGLNLGSAPTPAVSGQPIQAQLIDLSSQRKAEQAAKAKAEAKRMAEQLAKAKAAAEAKAKAEAAAKAKAAAEAKAKAEAAAKAKAAAEAKAKAEAAAKAKAAAEAKAKAEAAAKAKAAAEAKRKAQQAAAEKKMLDQQMAAEAAALQKQQQAIQARRNRQLQSSWIGQLKATIQRNWVIPPGYQPGQSCQVTVKQDQGGYILSLQIGQCTGDELFRRSVETAVKRSEPLPLAPNPQVFQATLNFTFKPNEP